MPPTLSCGNQIGDTWGCGDLRGRLAQVARLQYIVSQQQKIISSLEAKVLKMAQKAAYYKSLIQGRDREIVSMRSAMSSGAGYSSNYRGFNGEGEVGSYIPASKELRSSGQWSTLGVVPIPFGCKGWLCIEGLSWVYTGVQERSEVYDVVVTQIRPASWGYSWDKYRGTLTYVYTRNINGIGQFDGNQFPVDDARNTGGGVLTFIYFCPTEWLGNGEVHGENFMMSTPQRWKQHC